MCKYFSNVKTCIFRQVSHLHSLSPPKQKHLDRRAIFVHPQTFLSVCASRHSGQRLAPLYCYLVFCSIAMETGDTTPSGSAQTSLPLIHLPTPFVGTEESPGQGHPEEIACPEGESKCEDESKTDSHELATQESTASPEGESNCVDESKTDSHESATQKSTASPDGEGKSEDEIKTKTQESTAPTGTINLDVVSQDANQAQEQVKSPSSISEVEGKMNELKKTDDTEQKVEPDQDSDTKEYSEDEDGMDLSTGDKNGPLPIEDEKKKIEAEIEKYGYRFNENGEMRHIKDGSPYQFTDQRKYEALGEIITDYIFVLLQTEGKLKKVYIPIDAKEHDSKSFIFKSYESDHPKKLVVLIHGTGVVRSGQWTRKLIMNNDLSKGTQLPYIKKAKEEGFDVLVLNTNYNQDPNRGYSRRGIRENDSPEAHGNYVWKHFISKAQEVYIVAHSYGGVVTISIAKEFEKEFTEKVRAVAFTDSVHSLSWQRPSSKLSKFLKKVTVNWVSSNKPLDAKEVRGQDDVPCRSAGTVSHEWTSCCAFEKVFEFFRDKALEKPEEKEQEEPEEAAGHKPFAKRQKVDRQTSDSTDSETRRLIAHDSHGEGNSDDGHSRWKRWLAKIRASPAPAIGIATTLVLAGVGVAWLVYYYTGTSPPAQSPSFVNLTEKLTSNASARITGTGKLPGNQ